MNYIFFLIPLLLIIPLLVSESQSQQGGFVYRGDTFQDVDYQNGTHVWTGGLPVFLQSDELLDNPNSAFHNKPMFVPYALHNEIDHVTFESGSISWIFLKDSCSFKVFNGGRIYANSLPVLENVTITFQEKINNNWINLPHNNQACNVSVNELENDVVQLIATKGNPSIDYVEIELKQKGGFPLETFYRSPVVSTGGKIYGFTESHTVEASGKIQTFKHKHNNYGLDISKEQVISKSEMRGTIDNIDFDTPIIITNSNGKVTFNSKDTVHDTLTDVKIKKISQSKLQSVYDFHNTDVVNAGQRLEIDPSYSSSNPTEDGVLTDDDNNDVCDSSPASIRRDNSGERMYVGTEGAGNTDDCHRSYIEWDTSSILDFVTITSTSIGVDQIAWSAMGGGEPDCEATQITNKPSTSSDSTLWSDIGTGTSYGDIGGGSCNNVGTTGTATTRTLDLGSQGNTDVQNLLSANWFAIGLWENGETIVAGNGYATFAQEEMTTYSTTDATLSITYSIIPPPDPVNDLTFVNGTNTWLFMNWTQPNLNTGNLTNYLVNYTTPLGNPQTFLANTTNTYYNATSLTSKTPYSFRVSALTEGGYNATGNILNVTTSGISDAIDDLTGIATSFSTVDLSWTQPDLYNGTLSGYMINYTTPTGSPSTIIVNNTGTSDISYEIFGLNATEAYSFRVGVWNEYGLNASGNIFNATTTANFIIGDISVPSDTNPNVVDISFTRNDINSTALDLVVKFPNTYNITCNMAYNFARTNNTYTNLDTAIVDGDYNSTTFSFTGIDNEIVDVNCWDGDGANYTGGTYLITQTNFPLLEQIQNFRNGTYGTMGMFGAIDFITMVVIIFSMIGFNRVNEAVGVFFNIALVGALAVFGIIELPTIIFGALAVIVMFAITSTRKD